MMRQFVSMLGICGAIAFAPRAAHATFYAVNTTNVDVSTDGKCSLREAVQAATTLAAVRECPAGTGDDQIFLPPGTYVSPVKLTVGHTLRIYAGGQPYETVIKSSNSFSESALFSVNAGASLNLQSLSLQKGTSATQTSGIYAAGTGRVDLEQVVISGFTRSGVYMASASSLGGQLSLYQTVLKNNSTQTDGGGFYTGTKVMLSIDNSTINNNTAVGNGGGLMHRGCCSANIRATTISDNSAARGGGFYNNAQGADGNYVSFQRVTLAGNSASVSGGGVVINTTTSSAFQTYDSILALNTAPSNPNVDGLVGAVGSYFGTVNAANISDGGGTPNLTGVTSTQLKLGPLLDMGGLWGSTPVRPLLKGSTAIDYSLDGAQADQRQIDVQDGDGNGSVKKDVGAYEVNRVWESEMHGYAAYSDMTEIDVSDGYSGWGGFVLHADAIGDYLTLPVYFAESGTYTVTLGVKTNHDAGTLQVSTGTTLAATSNFGSPYDAYTSYTGFAPISLGTRSFNAGRYYFKLRVTGKLGLSSGYQLYPDYIEVVKN